MWFGVAVQPSTDVIQEPVGREPVLAALDTLLESASGGRGGSLLVLGEAGIGKSTIAGAAATRAAGMGFRVALGWCSAVEMPPYWPWRRILRELGLHDQFAVGASSRVDELDRQLLFASVVEALDAASRREPLLLVVEDLHWADLPSLRLLRTVVDAVPAIRVALVVTCRDDPGEAAPEVRERLSELPTSVRREELAGLDQAAVAMLVARIAGGDLAPAVVADVGVRTGGNQFFVGEVVRLLVAQGAAGSLVIPAGVREVLERRLARLPQPCHALLTAAAVAGDPINEPLVAAVSGLDEATVVALLDMAARARLLVHDPVRASPFRFTHALVKEVLEDGLSTVERARLHQRVAEELEGGGDAEALADRLAYHWSHATGPRARELAAAWSLRAARAAMAGLGFEQAVVGFRRALAGPDSDRVAVLLELGEAERLSGDLTAARATYLEAGALAGATGRTQELALAALGLGGGVAGFEVQISDERQVELLRQADAALPPGDGVLRAAVRGRLSLALAEIGSLVERVRLAEEAVAMATRVGDGRVEAAVLAAYCDAVAGPDFVAVRLTSAERILRLAESAGDRVGALLARRLRLVAHLEAGDFAAADAEIDAYRRTASTLASPCTCGCRRCGVACARCSPAMSKPPSATPPTRRRSVPERAARTPPPWCSPFASTRTARGAQPRSSRPRPAGC